MNIEGINLHQLVDIPIVSCGGVTNTLQGQVIAIFHQYAHLHTGPSIDSSGQMEWFGNHVDNQSRKVGGNLLVSTSDGYSIALNVTGGLAYFGLRPYTTKKWDLLPHLVMTSDNDWDPSVLDCDFTMDRTWLPLELKPLTFHPRASTLWCIKGEIILSLYCPKVKCIFQNQLGCLHKIRAQL